MKTPKPRFQSSITGKFVSKKTAAAKPDTTFKVNDYPTRMLRKLVRILERDALVTLEIEKLIYNIKKKMGWK